MKLDEKFLYEPKCFEMLVSATGLLSGIQRRERIIAIAKRNIWLAARCKNTCINEEDDIVDWIIRRAHILFSKFNDIYAIAAMMELREYGELSRMLGIMVTNGSYAHLHKDVWSLIQENERSISKAFSVLSQYLDIDFSIKLFRCLTELGYTLESNAYNSIIARIDNQEEIEKLITQMTSSGIEADAATYFHLLRKAETYEESLVYFEKLKLIVDYVSDGDLVIKAYNSMFRKARNLEDSNSLLTDYKKHYQDGEYRRAISLAYYSRAIEISTSYKEAKEFWDEYKSKFITRKESKKLSSRQKKAIVTIVDAFIRRISLEKIQYNEALEIFSWITNEYSNLGNRLIKESLDSISHLVRDIIRDTADFSKGKMLLQSFTDRGLWVKQSSYDEMLLLAKSKEEVDYVLENRPPSLFKPQYIVRAIQSYADYVAEYLFEKLYENHYPFNIIHYNAIIKKVSLEKAFQLVQIMYKNNIVPDKYTIQPMLRKWTNIQEFIQIVKLATSLSILADERTAPAVAWQATNNNLAVDFINVSYEGELGLLESSWKKAINEAGNILLNHI